MTALSAAGVIIAVVLADCVAAAAAAAVDVMERGTDGGPSSHLMRRQSVPAIMIKTSVHQLRSVCMASSLACAFDASDSLHVSVMTVVSLTIYSPIR